MFFVCAHVALLSVFSVVCVMCGCGCSVSCVLCYCHFDSMNFPSTHVSVSRKYASKKKDWQKKLKKLKRRPQYRYPYTAMNR